MSQSQAAFQWQIIWRKVAVFQKGVESKVKTLDTLQKLSHIGKILCKVIFICSIVGFCFCIAGMLSMAVGAKELMRLGILTICIPLGTQVITELIYEFGAQVMQGAAPFKVDAGVNVTLGIMLLFMSLLCRLGAEYRGKNL